MKYKINRSKKPVLHSALRASIALLLDNFFLSHSLLQRYIWKIQIYFSSLFSLTPKNKCRMQLEVSSAKLYRRKWAGFCKTNSYAICKPSVFSARKNTQHQNQTKQNMYIASLPRTSGPRLLRFWSQSWSLSLIYFETDNTVLETISSLKKPLCTFLPQMSWWHFLPLNFTSSYFEKLPKSAAKFKHNFMHNLTDNSLTIHHNKIFKAILISLWAQQLGPCPRH